MVTFLKRKDKLCQTYNIAFLNNHLSPPQKNKANEGKLKR